MDTLRAAGIYVDDFRKSNPNVRLLFLTHAHTDHATSRLQRCEVAVYCTPLTAQLLDAVTTLHPLPLDQWHVHNGVKFYLFATEHCPGSMGIYFADHRILYLGDTRVTSTIKKLYRLFPVDTTILDTLHMEYEYHVPTITQSAQYLADIIRQITAVNGTKKRIYLCLPHLGSVLLLAKCNIQCILDPSLKPIVANAMSLLGLASIHSHVVAVGHSSQDQDIVPSALHFVVNGKDPYQLDIDQKQRIRLFVTFHASTRESDFVLVHSTLESPDPERWG